jgi:hypothetical protein
MLPAAHHGHVIRFPVVPSQTPTKDVMAATNSKIETSYPHAVNKIVDIVIFLSASALSDRSNGRSEFQTLSALVAPVCIE